MFQRRLVSSLTKWSVDPTQAVGVEPSHAPEVSASVPRHRGGADTSRELHGVGGGVGGREPWEDYF
jgi:hypothetical protein